MTQGAVLMGLFDERRDNRRCVAVGGGVLHEDGEDFGD